MGAGVALSDHGFTPVGSGCGQSGSGGDRTIDISMDCEMSSMSWTSDSNCCLTGSVLARTLSAVVDCLAKKECILPDFGGFLVVEVLGEVEMFLFRLVTEGSR